MTQTVAQTKRDGFSREDDFEPIMSGNVVLPNFEELPLENGIAIIACGAGLTSEPSVRNAKIPGSESRWGHWARYFLVPTQWGALSGIGYVIWWTNEKGGTGHVGRFAICAHEQVTTSTPEQERRGHHTGYCSKCGLNLSVDSCD